MDMTDEIKNITPVDGHVKMSERKCAVCGETFSPPTMDRFLCDRCLYKKNHRSLTRMVVCKQCGRSFRGGLRAWYCPDCRHERAKEAAKRARQRKENGESRHIGDTDICVDCGGEYIVESGLQRRCKKCAAIADKAFRNAHSRRWRNEHTEEMRERRIAQKVDSHICPWCGKTFTPSAECSKYCSSECAKAAADYTQRKKTAAESAKAKECRESGRILPLRRLRLAAGLTQKQLAERIYATPPTIVKYERGIRPITDDTAERIAAVLHCTPDEIKEDQ